MAAEESGGSSLDLSQLRNLVRQYIDNHLYKTAHFWADKVCSLSNNNVQDVLWLSHTLFLMNQYLRAAQLLKSKGLIVINPVAKYLAAKCYYECKDWRAALEVLDGDNRELKIDKSMASSVQNSSNNGEDFSVVFSAVGGGRKIESATALLRGMVYEALENREIAFQCYKDALQHDVYCYEALDKLVSHCSLTSSEEIQLLEALPYSHQCSSEEAKLVRFAYECKINKYSKPIEPKLPSYLEPLHNNLDYVVSLAEKHFNNCNYRESFKYSSIVIKDDPLHESCLPLYISCLVELREKNDLYNVAHRLVNTYPTKSVSWYAIGAYYLLIKKNEAARKYFSKATAIDYNFGPAWLGFAHSFACEGERDQAISAYYSASKYMPGSHLPYLYLGLEYSLSNNVKLAAKFYKEALAIAPDDPHIRHELGNLAYQNGEYEQAETYFFESLKRMQTIENDIVSDIWEPLYNNIGHTLRKLKKYNEALDFHQKALLLNPRNASTCSSTGLCLMLLEQYDEAIVMFHRALSLKREDTMTIDLLRLAMVCLSGFDFNLNPEQKQSNSTIDGLMKNESITNSMIDLSCDSKSLSFNNLTNESDAMDSSQMSMEMSNVSTPM